MKRLWLTILLLITNLSLIAAEPTLTESFNAAWSAFQQGSYEEAEQLVDQRLPDSSVHPYHEGNFRYLKGILESRKDGRATQALAYLEESYDLYMQIDMPQAAFNAAQVISSVQLDNEQFPEAMKSLDALEILAEEEGYPLGYLYELRSSIALQNQDYKQGLEHSWASLASYKEAGDQAGVAGALIQVGFFLILTGQHEDGFKVTLQAQDKIVEVGDRNKLDYSRLNFVLYDKATCKQPCQQDGIVLDKLRKVKDSTFARHLEFALNYSPSPKSSESYD